MFKGVDEWVEEEVVGGRGLVSFILKLDSELYCYWATLECQLKSPLVLYPSQSPAQWIMGLLALALADKSVKYQS